MVRQWLARVGALKSVVLRLRSLIFWTFVIAVLVLFICNPSWFWPGGVGIGKDQTVTTTSVESVEKDAKGKLVKTINTTKLDDGKTLWDWLSLLGVPLSLAVLGFWLQQNQQRRAEVVAKEQKDRDEWIAQEQRQRDEKTAKELRDITANEAKEEVLQVYFDRLSTLLVDKNLLAIASKVYATKTQDDKGQSKIEVSLEERELLDSAVDVIRARTLSILRRFENDSERKTSVIRFLIEADIISKLKLSLSDANLSRANLKRADLSGADLRGANLMRADLSGADLRGADLTGADLSESNLSKANLFGANLCLVNLSAANLTSAVFYTTNWLGADLNRANLSGTAFRIQDLTEVEKADFQARGASLYNLSESQVSSFVKR
jgi:uncharacterized protein YjbI with pentapeptide repeats